MILKLFYRLADSRNICCKLNGKVYGLTNNHRDFVLLSSALIEKNKLFTHEFYSVHKLS